ncbi:putative Polycomb group protein ASXL1 isoform X4 [Carcharodon carcharias]|uniref:putative Polycomb group protein ASXL1 isoform X4 n=1 Tax=Carcharodon carcharias TaxID=13397 RepID=UPI001B7DB885|nr:putative Polycomb group protein ASXL1 isoform X4 [Carcharodon carcharias]
MKDKQKKKKDRTWAEAARMVLENYSDAPMTPKQILHVIETEGLKEMRSGTSPLACLNAMLHTNSRADDGMFYRLPGRMGLYTLKKDALLWPKNMPIGDGEGYDDGPDLESCDSNETSTTGEENDASPVSDESSSNASCSTDIQGKQVSPGKQNSHKATQQPVKQQPKKKIGVPVMMSKSIPRVVLTPLKVNGEHVESASAFTAKHTDGESSSASSGSSCTVTSVNAQYNRTEMNKLQCRPSLSRKPGQHFRTLRRTNTAGQMKRNRGEEIDVETPGSILVNTNLRALINSRTFTSLPLHFQQQLLFLLPEVDRQVGTDGIMRLSSSALNNEFFTSAAQGWKERLAEGEFTPEMQLRLRQEMEKEKKVELWKENFFEDYYGQKLGLSKEESEQQTSIQVEIENEASSPVLAGPSKQQSPVKKQDERLRKCTRSSKVDLKCRVKRSLIKETKTELPEPSEKTVSCTVSSQDTRSQKQHNHEAKVFQAVNCADEDQFSLINNDARPGQLEEILPNKSALNSKPILLTERPVGVQSQEHIKSDGCLELTDVQPAGISKDQITCLTIRSAVLKSELEHNSGESKEQKRKSSEHSASTSGPEKKPRLEDHQSFRTAIDSFRTEKEHPTKEEPKVPPIRIQLSRIKPPWVVKGQPTYQICPRIVTTIGTVSRERTGARTLADIKARAQQARAQREAAAAAAANVTVEGGGRGSSGNGPRGTDSPGQTDGKTKALEQTTAKHQYRAQLFQTCTTDEPEKPSDGENSVKQGVIIEECVESNLIDTTQNKLMTADDIQQTELGGDASYTIISSKPPDLVVDVQESNQVTVSQLNDIVVSDGQTDSDETAILQDEAVPETLELPADRDSICVESNKGLKCETVILSFSETDDPVNPLCDQTQTSGLKDKTTCFEEPLPNYGFAGTVIAETKNTVVFNTMDIPVVGVNTAASDSLPSNDIETKANTTDVVSTQLSVEFPETDLCEQEVNRCAIKEIGSPLIHEVTCSPTSQSHEEKESDCVELNVSNQLETSTLLEMSNEPHVAEKQMTSVIVSTCSNKDPSHSLAQKPSPQSERLEKKLDCSAPVDAEECVKEHLMKQEQAMANGGHQSIESDVEVLEDAFDQLASKEQQNCGSDLNKNGLYYNTEIANQLPDESCIRPTNERIFKDDRAPVCSKSGVIVESPDACKGTDNGDLHKQLQLLEENQLQKDERPSECQNHKPETLYNLNQTDSLLRPSVEEPKRVGNFNRPLSSVEVNNPLVTQLLQGSLPLEKVLPQSHSGTKLEITRLLVPPPMPSESPQAKQERNFSQSTIDHVAQTTDIKSIISGVHSGIKLADYHLHKILSGDFRDLSQKRLEQMKSTVLQSSKHYVQSQMVLDRDCKSLGEAPVLQEQLNRTPILSRPVEESGTVTQKITQATCSFEDGSKELMNVSPGNTHNPNLKNPVMRSMPETLKQISSSTVSGYYIPNTPTFCKSLETQNTIFGSVIAKACSGMPGRQKVSHGYLHNTVVVQNDGSCRATEVIKIQSKGSVIEHVPAIAQTSPERNLIGMESMPNVRRDWLPKLHESFKVIKTENIPTCRGNNQNQDIIGINDGAYIPFDSKDKLYVGPIKMDCNIGKVMKETGLQFQHSSEHSLINSQLSIQQQLYGKLPKLSFSTTGFSHITNTSVSELSMGSFPASLAGSVMSLSQKTNFGNHNSAVPAQTFAESSGVNEMTFKCSCRLKAMIMCKGCGAFCHDDCIGPSKLCVSCLVVR